MLQNRAILSVDMAGHASSVRQDHSRPADFAERHSDLQ